jgi:hypothetical protein
MIFEQLLYTLVDAVIAADQRTVLAIEAPVVVAAWHRAPEPLLAALAGSSSPRWALTSAGDVEVLVDDA